MTKKNLVQELRELADPGQTVVLCQRLREWASGLTCEQTDLHCDDCVAQSIFNIVNRIEAEFDPKPEPDTVEKVAKDMADCMAAFHGTGYAPTAQMVDGFCKRLEALGVTFDD